MVFEDTGTIDQDVVHLHLEHRVARRLLGRFLAQGFVHHDLFRACVLAYDDPFPRVVLFGRLSLYGANAARLHDELVAVSARWTNPKRAARRCNPIRTPPSSACWINLKRFWSTRMAEVATPSR